MDRFPSTALPAIRGDREHTLTSAGCDSNLAVDLWYCEDGASRLLEACRARPDTTTRGRALRQGVRHTGRNSGVRDEYAIAPTIDNVILQRVYGNSWRCQAQIAPAGWVSVQVSAMAVALTLIEPRVWSIDARFFGWRRIDIPASRQRGDSAQSG